MKKIKAQLKQFLNFTIIFFCVFVCLFVCFFIKLDHYFLVTDAIRFPQIYLISYPSTIHQLNQEETVREDRYDI